MIKAFKTCFAVALTCILGQSYGQLIDTKAYDLGKETKHATLTEAEKKEQAVILADEKFYEYIYNKEGDLELYLTHHRHIHINDVAVADKYNRVYLPVSSPVNMIAMRLRTVTSDGKIREMYKGDMKQITEDGVNYMILAVEGIEKNTEMEYYYTVRRNVGYFLTEWLQSDVQSRKTVFNLTSPENLIFETKVYNGTGVLTDTTYNEKNHLVVQCDSVPALDANEKYTHYQAHRRRLEAKLIRNKAGNGARLFTWADAGNRFYAIMHDEETTAKKDIEKLASSLQLKKKSQEEQVRAVENFIKTTINNKDADDKPTIGSMLKKHYGSDNQITSLYILMYEHLKIPVELVITTSKYQNWFDPDFDTWNFLDEYLLYLPSLDKYIEPTNYLRRLGTISPQYTGANGLFVKKITIGDVSNGLGTVKQINATTENSNYDNMDATITFEKDMKEVRIYTQREYGGYADGNVKAIYYYSDAEGREKLLNDLLDANFKEIKTKTTHATNWDLNNEEYFKPFTLESTVTLSSLIEKADENVVFTIGMVIGEQVQMYQDHVRQNPINIDYPHSYRRTIRVTIPDGYSLKGVEKLKMDIVKTELGAGFTSAYTLEGNKLVVTVNEYYNKEDLPATAFEDFKAVINAAADFNKIKLVLVKS